MKTERTTRGVESKRFAAKAGVAKKRSLTVRLSFDPVRNKQIQIARVHSGDRVAIKIHRVGYPDSRLYLAFNVYGDSVDPRPGYGHGSGAVITPVRDDDLLTLTASNMFGAVLSRKLDSRDGAILELGTGYHLFQHPNFQQARYEQGHFEIEIRIYAGNRWNIKPRSYL